MIQRARLEVETHINKSAAKFGLVNLQPHIIYISMFGRVVEAASGGARRKESRISGEISPAEDNKEQAQSLGVTITLPFLS